MKTFNLTLFRQEFPQYKHISDQWLIWFIGFFEADGSFTIATKNIELVLTQYELNKFILEEIKEKFNFGNVLIQRKHIVPGRLWTYRFIVRDFRSQAILLTLFKDNLVLNTRSKRYNQFIDIFNQKLYKAKNSKRAYKVQDINYLTKNSNLQIYPTMKDAWLSGFTDGDGYFYTGFTMNMQLSISYSFHHSYLLSEKFFDHIKNNFFNEPIGNYIRNKKGGYTFSTIKKFNIITEYFDKFNLKTIKIYDYLTIKHAINIWMKKDKDKDMEQLISLIKKTCHKKKKRDWDKVLEELKKMNW